MIYLYWYLGIGVVVVATLAVVRRVTRREQRAVIRGLLELANPKRKRLSYRILNDFIPSAIGFPFAVALWPGALIGELQEMRKRQRMPPPPEWRPFAAQRTDLLEPLTVEAIERREAVIDPLGAVPELPFGHLNSAWKRFLARCPKDAELWSFSARWETSWGRVELCTGYVTVREGAPCVYFLTTRKDLTEEAESLASPK